MNPHFFTAPFYFAFDEFYFLPSTYVIRDQKAPAFIAFSLTLSYI